jgi:hypothetical protein
MSVDRHSAWKDKGENIEKSRFGLSSAVSIKFTSKADESQRVG